MQISLLFLCFDLRKPGIKQNAEKYDPPMIKDNSENRKANNCYDTDCG